MKHQGLLKLDQDNQAWKGIVKTLYRDFERFDTERALLRAVDRAILAERSPSTSALEAVFAESVSLLSDIYNLREPGRCYVYTGNELIALNESGGGQNLPPRLQTSTSIVHIAASDRRAEQSKKPMVLSRADRDDPIFEELGDVDTILLQPIHPDIDDLLGVLVFVDRNPVQFSVLGEQELHLSVAGLAQQLSIAYEHWSRADREQKINQLWEVFLSKQLGPTKCFATLATMVPRFLPTFGPLKLDTPPEIQILIVERTNNGDPLHLTIRATTGTEASITKIDISKSISGLLVEQSQDDLPFFCDNPTSPQWESRYKSYLGGNGLPPIKTELAVRLNVEDATSKTRELVGVLNLESPLENAFKIHHRSAIRVLAAQIAPMVAVFEERIQHNTIMHQSVMSTTSKYLDSLAEIFSHGIRTPLLALRANIDFLRKLTDDKLRPDLPHIDSPRGQKAECLIQGHLDQMDTALDRLLKDKTQISVFTDKFAADISGFGEIGRFELWELISETVELAKYSFLAKGEMNIRVVLAPTPPAYAFCSPLLKQHLFSILTNAIYAIQERQDDEPLHDGIISITVEQPPPPTNTQEIALNLRWLIKIRDNGRGVNPTQLKQLQAFQTGMRFRKSPGQGFGLLAAQRYLGSIGGLLSLDSEIDKYFEVRLLVDEFKPAIHQPMSTQG